MMRRWLCIILLVAFCLPLLAGEDEEEEVPKEQQPVEERETGDSIIEILGEIPGKIITFPLKITFKGVSKLSGMVDYHRAYQRVTDFLTSDDGRRKIRPVFSPPGGGGLLIGTNDLLSTGSKLRAAATLGVRTRRQLYLGYRAPNAFTTGLGFELTGGHFRLPDEDFFGIGNNTLNVDETNYLFRENLARFRVIGRLSQSSMVGFSMAYSDVVIGAGRDPNKPTLEEIFDPVFLPGADGAKMWTARFSLYHDSRDQVGQPAKGAQLWLSYEVSEQTDDDLLGYRKLTLDAEKYLNLFYRRILVVRVRGEMTDSPDGKTIPFFRLGGLGGTDIMRGYRPVRFRDRDLFFTSLEYRFPIHSAIDVIAAWEEGRVFNDVLEEFDTKGFKYSYGAGMRIHSRTGLVTSFLFAKSEEQFRFVLGLNTELGSF
jgi:outer membrane protein assembly factor BamA